MSFFTLQARRFAPLASLCLAFLGCASGASRQTDLMKRAEGIQISASELRISTTAAAPSLIPAEFPAVTALLKGR